jgi:hypothetical protein
MYWVVNLVTDEYYIVHQGPEFFDLNWKLRTPWDRVPYTDLQAVRIQPDQYATPYLFYTYELLNEGMVVDIYYDKKLYPLAKVRSYLDSLKKVRDVIACSVHALTGYCPNVRELLGRKMVRVENLDNEEIRFTADNNKSWRLYHEQGCCEEVRVEDIAGDLSDLVGSPLLMAEEVINDQGDCFTWTFYKFATIKGYVTIRWYGESNGCYSETVDFEEII